MEEKICGRCKEVKLFSEFCKNKGTKTGLTSYCKSCLKQQSKKAVIRSAERERLDPEFKKRRRQATKRWREKNPEKFASSQVVSHKKWNSKRTPEYNKNGFIKSTYGITLVEYEQMLLSQNGVCKICGKAETRKNKYTGICRLHIDHDHETGKVRGLLCCKCNFALGALNTRALLESAIRYLEDSVPKENENI